MLGGHEKTCLHSIVWFQDNKYALDEVMNVDMCVTRWLSYVKTSK